MNKALIEQVVQRLYDETMKESASDEHVFFVTRGLVEQIRQCGWTRLSEASEREFLVEFSDEIGVVTTFAWRNRYPFPAQHTLSASTFLEHLADPLGIIGPFEEECAELLDADVEVTAFQTVQDVVANLEADITETDALFTTSYYIHILEWNRSGKEPSECTGVNLYDYLTQTLATG